MLSNSRYIAIVILLIVSIGIYLNTLSNTFVYDDGEEVLQNKWIRDVRYIPHIFLSNFWAFKGSTSNYYRPLKHIVYMLNYHIFGLKPLGFHLTNIIFHAGVSVFVFIIVSMLINREGAFIPAFVAAFLFAVHPIHTEAVSWISSTQEPLFTFFYLFSFYFYIRSDGVLGKRYILSVLFFSLSVLCKETGVILPITLFAYDYSFRKIPAINFSFSSLWFLLRRYSSYIIIAGLYLILRTYAVEKFFPSETDIELNNYEYFLNIFSLFIKYLLKLLLPINMKVFYVLHPILSIFTLKGIICIIITLAIIYLVYHLRNKNNLIFLSLLFIVIPLIPALYLASFGKSLFAERYLYLPSFGFVILLSLAIEKVYHLRIFKKASAPVMVSIFVLITAIYAMQTIKRNYVWKDNYTLWMDTVKKSPDGYRPQNLLGNACLARGLVDEAIKHYKIALRLKPDYSDAYNNLGNAYKYSGLMDKAIEEYQMALRLKPNSAEIHNNLGTAYLAKGLTDKAMRHYQIALKLNPSYSMAYYNMGNISMIKGLLDNAIEYYQTSLKLNSDDPATHRNLGIAYCYKKSDDKALKHFQEALRLKPDDPLTNSNIAIVYHKMGFVDRAIWHYQIALKLNPNDPGTHNNIGIAYKDKGLIDKALEHFEIAVRLKPDFALARENLRKIVASKGFTLK